MSSETEAPPQGRASGQAALGGPATSLLFRRTSVRQAGSEGELGAGGHNAGIFLQRARSGRGCSARASAGIERSQLRADWHRYAVSWDHRRIIDAGGRYPQLVSVGVGKRRWYATIFSFDRPRSRSVSTERRGRSLSQAGFTSRSSSPWSLPCRPLVFTRASSVFIPAVPSHIARQCGAVCDNTHRLYGVPLKFDRNASAGGRAPSEWLGRAFASPPARGGGRRLWPMALKRSPAIFGFFPAFF